MLADISWDQFLKHWDVRDVNVMLNDNVVITGTCTTADFNGTNWCP